MSEKEKNYTTMIIKKNTLNNLKNAKNLYNLVHKDNDVKQLKSIDQLINLLLDDFYTEYKIYLDVFNNVKK